MAAMNGGERRVIGRTIAHALMAALITWGVFALLRWLGGDPVLAAAIGLAVAVAPGAYDVYGRDLMGRRIHDDDPIEGDDPFVRFAQGKYSRDAKQAVNQSDFIYIARNLDRGFTPLAPMIRELDLPVWQAMNPESDLAEAVMVSLETQLDAIPDWAAARELPLYALFLLDMHDRFSSELGRHYDGDTPTERPRRLQ